MNFHKADTVSSQLPRSRNCMLSAWPPPGPLPVSPCPSSRYFGLLTLSANLALFVLYRKESAHTLVPGFLLSTLGCEISPGCVYRAGLMGLMSDRKLLGKGRRCGSRFPEGKGASQLTWRQVNAKFIASYHLKLFIFEPNTYSTFR